MGCAPAGFETADFNKTCISQVSPCRRAITRHTSRPVVKFKSWLVALAAAMEAGETVVVDWCYGRDFREVTSAPWAPSLDAVGPAWSPSPQRIFWICSNAAALRHR
jgi:hypothetical protein